MKQSFLMSGLVLLAGTLAVEAQTAAPGSVLPTQPVPASPVPTPPVPGQAEVIPAPTPMPSQPLTTPETPSVSPSPLATPLPNPTLQSAPAAPAASFVDLATYTVPRRFWFNAEYLLWFMKGSRLPPLLTSGSVNDAAPAALGQPNTQVLIGGPVGTGVHSGGRFSGGYWFTENHIIGVDAGFLFVGSQTRMLGAASNGDPVLGRPFINALNGQETASPVAYPGYQSGAVTARLGEQLWVADVDLRTALFYQPNFQLSLLGGFRYLNLSESLHTSETDLYAPDDGPSQLHVADWIHTNNNFYGGQLGSDFNWVWRRWSVDLLGKVALGVMDENARLRGSTLITYAGGSTTAIGMGSLVQPSNSGSYGQDRFAVVPEATATLGFAVTQHIRFTLGYTFLYASTVFRPGDQIDRTINPTEGVSLLANQRIVGPARPNFTLKTSDFWAQGINFGMQVRY